MMVLNLWKNLFKVEKVLLCLCWIFSENIRCCLLVKLKDISVCVMVGFI